MQFSGGCSRPPPPPPRRQWVTHAPVRELSARPLNSSDQDVSRARPSNPSRYSNFSRPRNEVIKMKKKLITKVINYTFKEEIHIFFPEPVLPLP